MGFEPTTPGITIRCSNQLSYTHQSCLLETHIHHVGAPGRNRTCNRRLRRPVLYPVELRTPGPELSHRRFETACSPSRTRIGVVGVEGFEPPTSCSQSRRATRLRYTPPTEPILPCACRLPRCACAAKGRALSSRAGMLSTQTASATTVACETSLPKPAFQAWPAHRYNARTRKWRNW